MPGIAGILGSNASIENGSRLEAMVNSMKHERFYASGTHIDERLQGWIGWTAQKGSPSDTMPVWNESKDICLILSGEPFADDLPPNANYLVHAYEKKGLKFLEKLSGWFSGVLIDLRLQKIVLFNDRFGLNRIYFHEGADGFYFASEAKALLKVLPALRELDARSFAEVVSCGCPLQNRTLFSRVALLPGGAVWTFSPGGPVRKEFYFRPESWENQAQLGEEEYYERLREIFPRVLKKYLRGEEKMGMSLTGGLDGRMIMAWQRFPANTLPCYTFGSAYRDCIDATLAKRVAQVCQQPHQQIPVDGKFLSQFPALAERAVYLSDGTMDVSGAAELYVNQIAREIAPVRLTGNYGSEILRGNVAFKPGPVHPELFDQAFREQLEAARATYLQEARCHPVSFIAFKQVPWHHYSRLSVEQTQITMRSPFLDNELVSLMYQAPERAIASKEPSFRLIAEGNTALGRIPTDRGLRHRPVAVITKAKNFFAEFTFKAEYAYDYGMPQWLARLDHALAPLHLEKLFLGRHKFCHFRIWYRDHLAGWLKDTLHDQRARSRSYLKPAFLAQVVDGHLKGGRNFTREIDALLRTELIQRQFFDSPVG